MRKTALTLVVTFIIGVFVGTAAAVFAQVSHANLPGREAVTITTDTAGKIISTNQTAPLTLSNADIGLRVVGEHDGRVVARLMAKVKGEWVEVQLASQNTLLGR